MNILPLTYLGNIEYFSLLAGGNCVVDVHENFVKQTYRNRCYVLSSNGPIALTVNLQKPDTIKCAVRDMRIDYSKRWQHQHWLSIMSAYRNSPYFDHYEELFEPFYSRRYDFLLDYNLELAQLVIRLLGGGIEFCLSDSYIDAQPSDNDFRPIHAPKLPFARYVEKPYYQVFSEKMAFVPNLSVVDLLFNEGPHSKSFL